MISGLYIKLIAAGVIVAAVLGGVWYVKGLQSKVQTLTTENVLLSSKIKEQNDAVDALKKDADERLSKAQEQIAKAQEETAKAKGKATVIYKTKPSDPSNLCKSALDLVNGVAK